MRRPRGTERLVVLTLVVALAMAACSTDDDTDSVDITSGDTSTAASPTTGATAGPATTAGVVRVVSQNLLHGILCPADTDNCRRPDRVAVFAAQLAEAGCPDLVSVQEANDEVVDLLRETVPDICGGAYDIVWDDDDGIDREVVLTTLPVVSSRRLPLAGPLRTVYWVRVASDVGLVDLVSTHLASGSDDQPCTADLCPPPCRPDDLLNTCQARQVVDLIAELAHPDAVIVLGGDLNAGPEEPAIDVIVDAGLVDTHLAAGNPECDPSTGEQCTSGRDDESLDDLTDPSSRQRVRIDYVFVGGDRDCTVEAPTGLLNADPAMDGPGGLAFPSDHTGVETTLRCTTDAEALAAAADPGATLPPPPSTTPPAADAGQAPDPATRAAIVTAYETLLNGDVADVDVKLSYLEQGEVLREYFVASFEAVQDIASRTRVRVDDVVLTAPDRAEVIFAVTLDGSVVVGPQTGEAVLVDGRWLVASATYCELSAAGAEQVPEPCRSG